ncbi:MAG: hypothetical protein ACT4OY_05780 [Alphaproteobacteria bacterium]
MPEKKRFFALCFAIMLMPAPMALAQDSSSSVEIYQDALDPSKPADQPLPNPLTFFKVDETSKTIVRKSENKSRSLKIKTTIADKLKTTKLQAAIPIPPRRPKTLNAPDSFVKKARADDKKKTEIAVEKPKPPKKPVKTASNIVKIPAVRSAQKAKIKTILSKPSKDVFEENLVKPSLQDILESIDPKAAKENAAANNGLSLAYRQGVTELPADIRNVLSVGLLSHLKSEPRSRLEIMGYASSPKNDESEARRVSLKRVRTIHDFLVGKGIESSRIDIRSMGLSAPTTRQPDRVDLRLLSP